MAALMSSSAFASSRTPEIRKKAVCMVTLMLSAQPDLVGDLRRVDHVEAQLLVDDLLLHLHRDLPPDLVLGEGGVQEEHGPVVGLGEHVQPVRGS